MELRDLVTLTDEELHGPRRSGRTHKQVMALRPDELFVVTIGMWSYAMDMIRSERLDLPQGINIPLVTLTTAQYHLRGTKKRAVLDHHAYEELMNYPKTYLGLPAFLLSHNSRL